jgi:hypothetical protein
MDSGPESVSPCLKARCYAERTTKALRQTAMIMLRRKWLYPNFTATLAVTIDQAIYPRHALNIGQKYFWSMNSC